VQQEFSGNRVSRGWCRRPVGIVRLVSGSKSTSLASAGFMVAMMLAPSGDTAAAVGSSVIWKMVVAPSKIEAWPST
jgi:hypothetical protein